MKYLLEVPVPTSSRYVHRSLQVITGGGFTGHSTKRQLDPTPGVLSFELPDDLPHVTVVSHLLDADFFEVELLEANVTRTRQLTTKLVPIAEQP